MSDDSDIELGDEMEDFLSEGSDELALSDEDEEEDDEDEEEDDEDEDGDEDEEGSEEVGDDGEEWNGIASDKSESEAPGDDEQPAVAGADAQPLTADSTAPAPGRYVPPHMRAAQLAEKAAGDSAKAAEREKLQRKAQGLLNKYVPAQSYS